MGQDVQNNHPVSNFVTTVDDVETLTGIDFFSELPNQIENAMESSPQSPDWGPDLVLDPSFIGALRTLCTVSEAELTQ